MLIDDIKKIIKDLKKLDTIELAALDAEKRVKNDNDFSALVFDFTTSVLKVSVASKQLGFKLSAETLKSVEEGIQKIEEVISSSVVNEVELANTKQHINKKINPNLSKEWKKFHAKKTAGLSTKLSSMGGLIQDPNQITVIKQNLNNGSDWSELSLKDDGIHTRLDLLTEANDEHNDAIMREAVMQLDSMLEDFCGSYKGDIKASRAFVDYVKEQTSGDQEVPVYSLSDQALYQANTLVEGLLVESKDEAKRILSEKKKKDKLIGEFDSYLSLDINDKELQAIYKKIKQAEKTLIDDQVKMSELEQKRSLANAKVMAVTSEFSKYVESYLATVELRDSTDRTIKYSNMALSIIEKYQVELQKRKTDWK